MSGGKRRGPSVLDQFCAAVLGMVLGLFRAIGALFTIAATQAKSEMPRHAGQGATFKAKPKRRGGAGPMGAEPKRVGPEGDEWSHDQWGDESDPEADDGQGEDDLPHWSGNEDGWHDNEVSADSTGDAGGQVADGGQAA